MQKKLIVLAIAALASTSAFADSSVTAYGLVDAAITSVAADGQQSQVTVLSGGLAGSRFGLKGAEDLDNGMKAVAVLEYGVDVTTTDTAATTPTITTTTTVGVTPLTVPSNTTGGPAAASKSTSTSVTATNIKARQQYVGLAGDFGTAVAGYLQTTGYDFENKYDVVAGSAVSPLGNVTKGGGFLVGIQGGAARAQHALAYISPSIGGLTVAVNYSTDLSDTLGNLATASTVAPVNVTATLVGAYYDNGPLSVGVVYAGTNQNAYVSNVTEYALGASYNVADVAKITATYQAKSLANGANTSSDAAYSVGAAIPAAAGTVVVSYAATNMATLTNKNGSGYTVGYLKGLSKTTTAYVAYSAMSQGSAAQAYSVDNSALASTTMTAGGNSSLIALGLQKKF